MSGLARAVSRELAARAVLGCVGRGGAGSAGSGQLALSSTTQQHRVAARENRLSFGSARLGFVRLGSARPTARTAKRGESDLRAFDKNWRNYGGAALKGQSGSRNRGEGCVHMINKTV